ncbi:hypothetical protein [Streptosporangium roseum]|uniref:hypothetical protein n=1 Tax=Streptosporangium roseum TaxID=2001 RepID=UPI00332FA809
MNIVASTVALNVGNVAASSCSSPATWAYDCLRATLQRDRPALQMEVYPADLEDLLARIERHEQKESNLQQNDDCNYQPAVLDIAATPEGFTARTTKPLVWAE